MESAPRDGNYQMLSLEFVHTDWNCQISVESVSRDENSQMVICGICTQRWELSSGRLWNLYLKMGTIKWSSVESVPREGNYQMAICGICTYRWELSNGHLWNLYLEMGTIQCYLWNLYLEMGTIKR